MGNDVRIRVECNGAKKGLEDNFKVTLLYSTLVKVESFNMVDKCKKLGNDSLCKIQPGIRYLLLRACNVRFGPTETV